MKKFFFSLLLFFSLPAVIMAQQDTTVFECFYTPGDTLLNDAPWTPTLTDTINMVVVLCVEKDQNKAFTLAEFVNPLQDNLEDYFDKVSFGNYKVNILNFLVESVDTITGVAYAFELPDTVFLNPPTGIAHADTSFVVQPWMVKHILNQADLIYDFNDFDLDNDAVVDFLAFVLIKFRAGGSNNGTIGLSINEFYETKDSTTAGIPVKIDGTGYGSYDGDMAVIVRWNNAVTNTDGLTGLMIHELGHGFFDFPDENGGKFTYALGQFCAMSAGGFNGRVSFYNPVFRISNGWGNPTAINSNLTLNLEDFDSSGVSYYYELPDFRYGPQLPQLVIRPGQKLYLTYYSRPPSIRWQATWPIPESLGENARGLLIWHTNPHYNNWGSRSFLPIDIESAHGKWDWIEDRADTLGPPYDRRAIRSNIQNPLYGFDSLEVTYSYLWEKYDQGSYIPMSTYPDRRIGSETCFFDPVNPKEFSFLSNPNSNAVGGSGRPIPYGRITPSGFKMDSLRVEGNNVKANIKIGLDANTITGTVTLPTGDWGIIDDIIIAPGARLTIPEGANLYIYDGSSIIVSGTLIAAGNVSEYNFLNFVEADNNGIVVNSGGVISMQYCHILNASIGIKTNYNFRQLHIDHCSFENCDVAGIQMNGMEQISSSIVSSTFVNNEYAISVTNCYDVTISNNTLTNNEMGIYLSNVTNPMVKANMITSNLESMPGIFMSSSDGYVRGNTISGHSNGIHLGNSSPDIGDNDISDNLYHGIYIGSGSKPNMVGELAGIPPLIYPISGYNNIEENGGWYDPQWPFDNDGSEIYVNSGNVNLQDGCNSIVDDRLPTGNLVNTQCLISGNPFLSAVKVKAANNFWGDTIYTLSSRFCDIIVDYTPYYEGPCLQPQGGGEANTPLSGEGVIYILNASGEVVDSVYPIMDWSGELSEAELWYALAEEKYLAADYNGATEIYAQIINSNSEVIDKYEAYRMLYNSAKLSGKDIEYFEGLYELYSSLAQTIPDSLFQKVFSQLGSLSLVGQTEYLPAIEEFDAIIQESPESEEAVYAEIDALTTALLLDGENLGKSSAINYISSGISEYHARINRLLKENFGSKSENQSDELIPSSFKLYQNYPNPFNPTTTIKYDIAQFGAVELVIFDILGRRVKTLVNEQQEAGSYTVHFNASQLASGVYFYKLMTNSYVKTRKMILIK